MSNSDLIIRGRRIVLPERVGPASIYVRNGLIEHIGEFDQTIDGELIEVGDESVVMAGLVDTHVHINEPGRTEWEGFETATRAAAAGGVTTVVDMPLNSIPATTSVENFKAKLKAAQNKCAVDVGFWGGVVPGNTSELAGMKAAGVVGFKCFLVPSGVDEFPHVTEADLRIAMPELTRLDSLLIVHAELPGPIDRAIPAKTTSNDYATFLESRPCQAENDAIELMIRLSREFGTRVHIVHLSSAEALPMLREAQASGVRISAETCPHYLHFAAEQIPAGATEFKCCPPIRERENCDELWRALADGTIGIVVSDHSPCPGSMKHLDTGDFLGAWGGIASLQLRLPVIWTEAERRKYSLSDLSRWLCSGPAAQVRIQNRKGSIAVGCDADLIVWSPDREFVVDASTLQHRHKISPYNGEPLKGVVQKTFLRGKKIYDDALVPGPARGEFILKQ
jgi:allantoinase